MTRNLISEDCATKKLSANMPFLALHCEIMSNKYTSEIQLKLWPATLGISANRNKMLTSDMYIQRHSSLY